MILNKCSCLSSSTMIHHSLWVMKQQQYSYKYYLPRPTHPPKSYLSTSTFKRRRNATNKRISKSEKRLTHIKKSMKQRRSKQKSDKRLETIRDNVDFVKEKAIPKSVQQSHLVQVISSQKFQTQVMDKIASFQNQIQRTLLPESMQRVNRPSEEERMRNSVVMDRKWWIWNLALACLPGILIACVCEYHQTEMKEYYKRMNKNLSKQKNGSKAGKVTDAGAGEGADNSILKTLAGDDKKGTLGTFSDALKAMFGVNLGAVEKNCEGTEKSDTLSKNNTAAIKLNKDDCLDDQMKEAIGNQQEQHNIEELLSRIKVLEEKLNVEVRTTTTKSSIQSTYENNDYDDIPKSNMRRRIEARQRQRMKEEEEGQKIPIEAKPNLQHVVETKVKELNDKIHEFLLTVLPPSLLGGDSNNHKSDDYNHSHVDNDSNISETEPTHSTYINNVVREDEKNDDVILKLIVDQRNESIDTGANETNMIRVDDQKEENSNPSSTTENELKDQKQMQSNKIWKWVKNRFPKDG